MHLTISLKQLIYFCILIFVVYGNSPNKIYGGEIGNIERYPYVVSIQYQNYHVCGGVIISQLHILTSASCVLAENNIVYGNIEILSGTNDLGKDDRIVYWRIYEVAYVIIHDRYEPQRNWINDLAILKLTSPMDLFRFREEASLVSLKMRRNGFHLVGWGVHPLTGITSRYLQMLHVRSIPPTACKGSGGSPIMMGRKIVGIISFISMNPEKPAIYTLAPHYEDWIELIKQKV
ncbi:hypothetical protein HCN44_008509 [Aphidius gifuensis]|uniref:Peptidase S1 domain-containing protein n=1 Tax=Aphidius gifuensis TaxID=684658 RepID=A0A834XMM9_APHGI|nr:hypothetical protein HCN44_008509 [Aphidius gifuensis]